MTIRRCTAHTMTKAARASPLGARLSSTSHRPRVVRETGYPTISRVSHIACSTPEERTQDHELHEDAARRCSRRRRDFSLGGRATTSSGRARTDVSGPGDVVADTLDGGSGDDVFRTRDGEADRITCGPGSDRALLDAVDVIADASPENLNGSCEVVNRRAPKAAETRSEDAQERAAAERVTG